MSSMKDITYINEYNVKFNFRVAAIIVDGEDYLIQHTDGDNYYSLVGGRVELDEDTLTTLIREIKEELNIKVEREDSQLIDVVENFFTLKNTKFHELLFIYRIDVSKYYLSRDSIKTLDKNNSINSWFSLDEMKELNIQPCLIKDILETKELNHIINRD